jgi:hypothetical protein
VLRALAREQEHDARFGHRRARAFRAA